MIKTAGDLRKLMKEDKIKIKEKAKKEDREIKKYLKQLAITDASKLLKKEIPELATMFYDYVCEFKKQLPYQYDITYYYKEFEKLCKKYGYKTELTDCSYGSFYNILYIKISWEE